jgi:hypothetical protein
MKWRSASILLLAGAAMLAAPAARADDEPTSSVARISQVQGAVSTQRGDSGDWSAATVNTPVVAGDRISTGEGSRVEIQLDYANVLRLDAGAVVRIADLTPGRIQIQVSQGLVSFDSYANSNADVEMDTPNLAIHPRKDGVYRVQVNSDTETLVAVRRGEAEVGTAEGSTTLQPGQLITVRGDSSSAQYRVADAPARDGFDHWNEERDKYIQRAQNSRNVNAYYTGAADLDANGTWRNVPDYGNVWTPSNVGPDWAPYRDGSWVWEPDWGWTWAGYEPWGWAPYHYGRWFLWGNSWAWWPGPVTPFYQPIWAPAYVSFFGFGGGGWGFGFGFGNFGWLPIGPCDHFFPWWGRGRGFNTVNITNITNINNINNFNGGRGVVAPLATPARGRPVLSNLNGLQTNARLRAGITAVPAARFGNGRISGAARPISSGELQNAQAIRGSVPVAPGRGSLSASGLPARAGTVPSRNLDSQHFFAHNPPAAVQRSFAAESAQLRQQIQQQRTPGANAQGRTTGREAGAVTPHVGETQRQPVPRQETSPQSHVQGNAAPERGNWSTFQGNRGATASINGGAAQPRATGPAVSAPQARPNVTENREGWQHFSQPQGQPRIQPYSQPGNRGQAAPSYHNAQPYQSRQLDLHHSIVEQRAPSGGAGRGYYSAPPQSSYAAPRAQAPARAPQPLQGYSAAPHYSAPPAAPHYSAPSAPHTYSGSSGGGGGYRGGGGNRGGGGGGGSGGGGHSGGGSSHSSGSRHP